MLLVVMSVALAGCFTSKRPVFDEATAVAAFGDGGRFAGYTRGEHGFTRDEAIEVRRNGKGYDFVDEKGHVTSVTFHAIGEDLFAAQARADGGGYDYVVVRVGAREALLYGPSCDKQDMARLKAFGVEIDGEECLLDKVADPKALFAKLKLGPPTSKLVKEAKE